MMNANNAYFLNLKRIGHEYEAARVERKARKRFLNFIRPFFRPRSTTRPAL